jgi:outer membrane protein assembly factor BamB
MRGARAWTMRAGAALAVALAGAAGARAQTPAASILDVRVVEGSSGSWSQSVTVTLSGPSASAVDVPWSTVAGSAIAGADFTSGSGSVHFNPGATTQTLSVQIVGDTTPEWSPTLQLDEVFFVDLGTPTNATLLKSRATVTIVDDDRALPGLQLVSAVADGGATTGRVRLQWRVPPAPTNPGPVSDVLVRWNVGASCTAPASAVVGVTGGEFLLFTNGGIPVNAPGETQVVEHLNRPFVRHCYALFAVYPPSTLTTERATVVATPLDTTSPKPVAWTYSAGGSATSVVPPTVGPDAVYTVSSDGVVHAMTRGDAGGQWPSAWNPVGLGKPAHNRSPLVPLPAGSRLFVGTESGEVHAVDGKNGAIVWSRSALVSAGALASSGGVQGTPAGLFKAYKGLNDVILVGSNLGVSSNTFYMLNPVNGLNVTTYSNGLLGAIAGMEVVDYDNNRAFCLTTAPSGTLWGFDLGAAGSPSLNPSTLPLGNPVGYSVGANGSPVLRNGRLYFGTTNGEVHAYRVADGTQSTLGLSDGEVKGFVFPDRRSADLYLSTNNRVWGVSDTLDPSTPMLTPHWFVDDIPAPSIALHRTGTDFVYVGSSNGRLYQIDVASADPKGTKKYVELEAGSQIGAPSLDGPNNLVLVGSATGVVYAVRVPLP